MRCELTRTHLVAVTIKPGIIALTDALVRMTLTAICSDHSGRAGRWSEDVPRARWLLAAPMLMPMA